jgi:sulfur relay (sulfurtransferase) DsrC/TusE family protein
MLDPTESVEWINKRRNYSYVNSNWTLVKILTKIYAKYVASPNTTHISHSKHNHTKVPSAGFHLPQHLKNLEDFKPFKKQLKTLLLQQSFYSIEEYLSYM